MYKHVYCAHTHTRILILHASQTHLHTQTCVDESSEMEGSNLQDAPPPTKTFDNKIAAKWRAGPIVAVAKCIPLVCSTEGRRGR